MRYALVDANRVVTNIVEINPDQAAHFGALYVGDHPVGIGSAYPEAELEPIPEPEPEPTPSELEILQAENKLLKAQIQAQTDRSDFIEDCIAEMAMQIYNE